MSSMSNCPICLDTIDEPRNFCDHIHESYCKSCICQYIENKVSSAYFGSCPIITCPSEYHQRHKKRKIISVEHWKKDVPQETVTRYCSLAGSLLAFLCGGCHVSKSLDVGYDPDASIFTTIEQKIGSKEKFKELAENIQLFCEGTINVEDFYGFLLHSSFPQLSSVSSEEAWEIVVLILKKIEEPERRANLHLRYLRDRPKIYTLCCNRLHCFKCKIKDYHEGKSCLENSEGLDHSIVSCPNCGISLVKGDGCNTVTCFCGKQFSWSVEKETSDRMREFLIRHPQNTSLECANVLYNISGSSSELVLAKAWQSRNQIIVANELKRIFKNKYWPYPSQSCLTLATSQLSEGEKEAINYWKNEHPEEIKFRERENKIALASIFTTYYPNLQERPVHAYHILQNRRGKSPNDRLVQSTLLWIESNKDEYALAVRDYEMRCAKQFLYLYGNKSIYELKPSGNRYCPSLSFCRETSNPDLTYSNNFTTVERVGSVSCYPAAFALLHDDFASFRVIIDSAPRSSNWLTFGIARKGMANSSSDGVGRTSNTWGMSDDRSTSSSSTIIASCGHEVNHIRKLIVGDILSSTINVVDGWAEISLNENEFVHRFDIPPGNKEDYVFAMSFANDHRISIIQDVTSIHDHLNKVGLLNYDHTVMYNIVKRIIRSELISDPSLLTEPTQPMLKSSIFDENNSWLETCQGDYSLAKEKFEQIRSELEYLLGIKRNIENNSNDRITWKDSISALSWYIKNRNRIRDEISADYAYNFSICHGEDAPFLAASTLVDFYSKKSTNITEEMKIALAFMQCFSEEQNAWYDYNKSLDPDALIENVAHNCRCLPRHTRRCPLANH